jgi:hypothetical protein
MEHRIGQKLYVKDNGNLPFSLQEKYFFDKTISKPYYILGWLNKINDIKYLCYLPNDGWSIKSNLEVAVQAKVATYFILNNVKAWWIWDTEVSKFEI